MCTEWSDSSRFSLRNPSFWWKRCLTCKVYIVQVFVHLAVTLRVAKPSSADCFIFLPAAFYRWHFNAVFCCVITHVFIHSFMYWLNDSSDSHLLQEENLVHAEPSLSITGVLLAEGISVSTAVKISIGWQKTLAETLQRRRFWYENGQGTVWRC